jgi:protein-tyrosine phosphatase
MATGGAKDAQELDREIERYREAATVALEQLQWVINYLHGIKKNKLAQGLDRNRIHIIEQARSDH